MPPSFLPPVAGRVDHVDNVDQHPAVASRPYRRPGACVLWTMWTIGQHVQAVRAWAVWTMWTIGQQAQGLRACVGCVGVGVDLWTMWTMWTMSCKSSTPFGGAGARRPCSHYCISIQYIFFLFLDYQHHCPHCPHSPFFIGRERGQRMHIRIVHTMSTRCPIPTIL